ncbi:kinase-like domain-containing protein [Mycena rebaudengoi]|nr:kinase-like domain-containing protein [Mycena rebaudengoi]
MLQHSNSYLVELPEEPGFGSSRLLQKFGFFRLSGPKKDAALSAFMSSNVPLPSESARVINQGLISVKDKGSSEAFAGWIGKAKWLVLNELTLTLHTSHMSSDLGIADDPRLRAALVEDDERDEEPIFGGGFANIYRALYGGKPVALKRLQTFHRGADLWKIRLVQQICREALVWQSLTHPHIVPLIGIDRESFPMSLWHGRRNVDKLLSEIARGLQYLHSHNVVHGDLHGANILITQEWSACLTDFGLTSLTDATVASTSHRAGSLRWMAPELINPDRFGLRFRRTPASDVYAFGSLCLELYTGLAPFPELSEAAAMFKIIDHSQRPKLFGNM